MNVTLDRVGHDKTLLHLLAEMVCSAAQYSKQYHTLWENGLLLIAIRFLKVRWRPGVFVAGLERAVLAAVCAPESRLISPRRVSSTL